MSQITTKKMNLTTKKIIKHTLYIIIMCIKCTKISSTDKTNSDVVLFVKLNFL